jgi:hypothetical protein
MSPEPQSQVAGGHPIRVCLFVRLERWATPTFDAAADKFFHVNELTDRGSLQGKPVMSRMREQDQRLARDVKLGTEAPRARKLAPDGYRCG